MYIYNKKYFIVTLVVLALFLITCIVFNIYMPKKQTSKTKIRIGWQTPWAIQGQIAQSLKNTDYLSKNNLEPEFTGFDSGAPLNEAALAGKVDVIFTADQPAATLLSKSSDWVIVSRLMYNRVSLYVPPKSSILSISDLKGKTVGMPFGAAAQRMAYKAEQDMGLKPGIDVKNVNLGIYEQSDLVKNSEATNWGNFDALAGFDPTPAVFEDKGLIKMLKTDTVISLVLVNKKYISENTDSVRSFLKSLKSSYLFYAQNQEKANKWFKDASRLNISDNALKISASVEPNLKAKKEKDIILNLNDNDYKIMQEAADFLFNNGLIKTKVDMRANVNLDYLTK